MQIDGKKVQDGNILEKWDMSGMYKHTTGSATGSHALKLISGGVGGGKNYWLVKNSWNEELGTTTMAAMAMTTTMVVTMTMTTVATTTLPPPPSSSRSPRQRQ